jgi:hypothetical protein
MKTVVFTYRGQGEPKLITEEGNREQGTGNREQIRNFSSEFKAQSQRRCFFKMRSTKKTVSLFQSHVFKHEFFLLESCPFPVPSDLQSCIDSLQQNWVDLYDSLKEKK